MLLQVNTTSHAFPSKQWCSRYFPRSRSTLVPEGFQTDASRSPNDCRENFGDVPKLHLLENDVFAPRLQKLRRFCPARARLTQVGKSRFGSAMCSECSPSFESLSFFLALQLLHYLELIKSCDLSLLDCWSCRTCQVFFTIWRVGRGVRQVGEDKTWRKRENGTFYNDMSSDMVELLFTWSQCGVPHCKRADNAMWCMYEKNVRLRAFLSSQLKVPLLWSISPVM